MSPDKRGEPSEGSKRLMISRTEFWVIVAVIVTFTGCITLAGVILDVETLIEMREQLELLEKLVNELTNTMRAPISMPEPESTVAPVIVPAILPTVTP